MKRVGEFLKSDSNAAADTKTYARAATNGNAESRARSRSIANGILPDLQISDGKDRIGVLDVVQPLRLHSGHFADDGHARSLN